MAENGSARGKSGQKFFSLNWKEAAGLLLIVVCAALMVLPLLSRPHEAERRAACHNNLRQLGTAFLMYAREDPAGHLPRMHGFESFGAASNAPGCENVHDDFDFGPDMTALYPDYVADPLLLVCPSGPHGKRPWLGRIPVGSNRYKEAAIDVSGLVRDDGTGRCAYTIRITNGDVSYIYLPWVVGHDTPGFYDCPVIDDELAAKHRLPLSGPAQLVALTIRLRQALALDPTASTRLMEEDIDLANVLGMLGELYVHGGCDTGRERQTRLLRFTDHVERDLCDVPISYFGRNLVSQSILPVLFDRVPITPDGTSHVPQGGNVLYLDGHVEFVKYPTRFPISESWIDLFEAVRLKLPGIK